tara:strand:- start:199 stop:348 length:150 start_codon:yes stop_codon:yes gene_type:complete
MRDVAEGEKITMFITVASRLVVDDLKCLHFTDGGSVVVASLEGSSLAYL